MNEVLDLIVITGVATACLVGAVYTYFSYRYNRIVAFLLNHHPELGVWNLADVAKAQRRFWVWPVSKVFKERTIEPRY